MNSFVFSMSRLIAIIFVIFSISFQKTFALTCWDNSEGELQLVSNDDWTFCTLIPDSNVNSVSGGGKVSGLSSENDDVAPYITTFDNYLHNLASKPELAAAASTASKLKH
uniref:Uncharacterized protein n=1 Tax=Panagrolaimus sp. PS1159 TaxID=55785 RepID=A0AC35FDE7_9BILA